MLVLARKVGQEIVIGKDIRITVVKVRSDGQVRLGVQAPDGVAVHRKEVAERIEREGREAS